MHDEGDVGESSRIKGTLRKDLEKVKKTVLERVEYKDDVALCKYVFFFLNL